MSEVKKGDTIKVHYTGKLKDGTVFDSSEGRDPIEFTVGDGKLIPGFEDGVLGMEVNQTKTLTLQPDDAYGEIRQELVAEVEKDKFPSNVEPKVGQQLQLKQPDGNILNVIVTNISDEKVVIDANHPLAGQTLIFDIELIGIN